MVNALTIDVEEYFHPSEVEVDPQRWHVLPSRIDLQISQILDVLDRKNVKATFFVLGWVADHQPEVIRRIAAAGHEIACHSYAHRLVYKLSPEQFRDDTKRAIRAIEEACGVTPQIYRAPSYSITKDSLWALEILVECGFTHDSSIYPIDHDRYGIPGAKRHAHVIPTAAGPIYEIPAATSSVPRNRVIPIGGGGYLRLLPYRYTSAGIRRVNGDEGKPVCIYFHPWELDPDQPHLATGLISRMRTYNGLDGMCKKLDRLLSDFAFSTVSAVYGQAVTRVAAASHVA